MRSSFVRRLALAAVAAIPIGLHTGCEPATAPPDPSMTRAVASPRPPVLRVETLLREYRPTLQDELDLHDPSDLQLLGGHLYILDRGNDRIAVTDTLLNLIRRFGGRGEGPGELQNPFRMQVLPSGRLAVAEIGNQRISVFTPQGRFVRSIPRATPHISAGAFDDTTYLVSGPGGRFGSGILYGPSGVGRPFGPTGPPERDLGEITSDAAIRVWVGDEDLVAVTRAREGVIEVYDRTGRLHRLDTIPEDIRTRLQRRQRGLVESLESQGLRVLGYSMVKAPSTTSRGELLLLLSLPDPFGLIYSPADGSFTRLMAPERPRVRQILRSASSGYLDGQTLYLTQDGGIAVFRVPEG